MRANDILNSIKYYEHELKVLKEMLPRQCAEEGHVWDTPAGSLVTICTRQGAWVDADPESTPRFGSRGGHWAIQPEHRDVYQRVCTRCGFIENRAPVVVRTSPFIERG